MKHGEDEPIDIIPSEKIAFIAYNIGVFESVQKFGSLIVNGKTVISLSRYTYSKLNPIKL
jgi:hypothetical protein